MTRDRQGDAGRRLRLAAIFEAAAFRDDMVGGLESLFAHLISQGRISPTMLSRITAFKHGNLAESAHSDLPRRFLNLVRGSSSEADLWATWRLFTRPLKSSVWLTGMAARPDLNGARASIIFFDSDAALIGVELCSSRETLHLPGQNLAWCPPEPADVAATAAVLSKFIGAEAAATVCGFLFCGRCERPCATYARCEVPHPPSRRLDLTRHAGWAPGGLIYYLCQACGRLQWRKAGRRYDEGEVMESTAPCWDGKHMTTRLAPADGRRFHARHPKLINSRYLRDDIKALLDTTVSLRISDKSADEECDVISAISEKFTFHGQFLPLNPSLDQTLPYLEELYLENVALYVGSGFPPMHLFKLDISNDLYPNLRVLSLVRMPTDLACTFNTSSLKVVHIRDWKGSCGEEFEDILFEITSGSTSLEELHAPGLCVRDFVIDSNSLSHLDLRNASDLGTLDLWTPNLKVLDVQSSHLEEVACLTDDELKKDLPPDYVQPPLLVRNGCSNADEARIAPECLFFRRNC